MKKLSVVTILSALCLAGCGKTITMVYRSHPSGAIITQNGSNLGRTPIQAKYKAPESFVNGGCASLGTVEATWRSGARTYSEVTPCHTGNLTYLQSFYFTRPAAAPNAAIDRRIGANIDRVNAKRHAEAVARRAHRVKIIQNIEALVLTGAASYYSARESAAAQAANIAAMNARTNVRAAPTVAPATRTFHAFETHTSAFGQPNAVPRQQTHTATPPKLAATPRPNATFYVIGNTLYGPNGFAAHRINNTIFYNNGVTDQKVGSYTFGSDGYNSHRIGSWLFDNQGHTYHRNGNVISGSDGTNCQLLANYAFCH